MPVTVNANITKSHGHQRHSVAQSGEPGIALTSEEHDGSSMSLTIRLASHRAELNTLVMPTDKWVMPNGQDWTKFCGMAFISDNQRDRA